MNFLGIHDTPRILTVLGADSVPQDKDQRASFRLSPAQREKGLALVRLAALLLFTFPARPPSIMATRPVWRARGPL